MVVLETRGLQKTFHAAGQSLEVLRGIDIQVKAGEFVALMGPSGCGKSTLLNIVGLADQPSRGEVLLDGVPTQTAADTVLQQLRRTKLGYVFQHFNLLSTLSVIENVMVPLILNRIDINSATEQAGHVLHQLGLDNRSTAMPSALSGGEMQRVAIARAIIHQPLLILADEPTGSLDSSTGEQVLQLLSQQTSRGIAVLMATHSDRAAAYCSRVIHLKDGVVQP